MVAAMFFRTKTIKGTPLVQLVEAFRNAEGQPRQRVVVSLGEARLPESEKHLIARAVGSHLLGQADLLSADLSEEAATWVRRIPEVVVGFMAVREGLRRGGAKGLDALSLHGVGTAHETGADEGRRWSWDSWR